LAGEFKAGGSFLKKEAKTFATLSPALRQVRDSRAKVFASFFKKKFFLT
jgi:hypothetical protein